MSDYFEPIRATPPPLNTTPPTQRTVSLPNTLGQNQAGPAANPAQRSISLVMGNNRHHGEDSPVMNETLSVIDEHIIDMNTPRSSLLASERRVANDSGSDYSSHIDHRLSYINGHETDEEERSALSEKEVMKWTPAQVSEYLKDVGVENRHCEIFKEQEISGEVLLGIDQASIFMKEFDLGLVGRRLRTWHKIKALQEEVKIHIEPSEQTLMDLGGDGASGDLEQNENGTNATGSLLPRIANLMDHPVSKQADLQIQPDATEIPTQQQSFLQVPSSENSPVVVGSNSQSAPDSPSRPSAASIRELNHSRRHSSADFSATPLVRTSLERSGTTSPVGSPSSHKKSPSFDRSWTMSRLLPAVNGHSRTGISVNSHTLSLNTDRNTFDPNVRDATATPSTIRDVDRGYVSGGEGEGRKVRNVLRKRDTVSATHSRQNSNIEEQRRTSLASKRHSRFGSADSIRDTVAAITSPAAKIYHGSSLKGRFRASSIKDTSRLSTSQREGLSPTVTKLEYADTTGTSTTLSSPRPDSEISSSTQNSPQPQAGFSPSFTKPRMSLRAISDAVTGTEKSLVTSPISQSFPIKESPIQSPSRTGSTTTSGASKSFELESTDASSKGTNGPSAGTKSAAAALRRKSKKETSAYTRGLEKKTPQEQMEGCDYSGWMKKKSSNLMTTWKPRLFVLRGRRLSYYYAENDTQEKGLIDISSHRVLPADNDRITGLHATVTGAKASPTSPSNAQTPTLNSTEAAAEPDSTVQKAGTDSMFIFKLVPPRVGFSRAVNFTKPTVHYFAVDNLKQGRLWMAALMKATIDRDESKPISSTYQQKTISLAKAKAMRHRPPALMGLDEKSEGMDDGAKSDETGLHIQGLGLAEESEGDRETSSDVTSTPDYPLSAPPLVSDEVEEQV